MANRFPKIETLSDIVAATEVTQKDGKARIVISCGPDTDSMEAFGTIKPPQWKSSLSSQSGDNRDWYGTNSYQEAMGFLRYGWKEGTEKVAQLAAKIIPQLPRGQRYKMRYEPTIAPIGGMIIDPVAVLIGSPVPYIGRFKTNRKVDGQKIVRIGLNVTASAGVDAETLMGKGSAVMALINVLQANRKEVDLTVYFATSSGSHALTAWHVKPAGMRTNPDSLTFAVVNPSSLRRLGFAMLEHIPAPYQEAYYSGYGMPTSMETHWPDIYKQFDVFVDSECAYEDNGTKKLARWENPQSQIEWVKCQLRKQGIDCQ